MRSIEAPLSQTPVNESNVLKVLAFPAPRQRPPDDGDEPVVVPPATSHVAAEPPQYDRITVRAITVAIVLSLFVHIILLVSPLLDDLNKEQKAPADEQGPLSVTIAQSKPQPPQPQQQPKQEEAVQQPTPTPRPTPTTRSPPVTKPARPRVPTPQPRAQIAINNGRTPPFIVPPPQTAPPTDSAPAAPPQPSQPTPPVASSFEEELAIRQRARRAQNGGAPDEVVESDNERANRIAKANVMKQQRSASPGQDPDQSGGIFDLRHTGLSEAEFVFNGWNRDFRRGMGRTYEVKAKDGDINLSVVRQMIEIIREQQPGDFTWYGRSHKEVVLSARPKDQKELELFLLKEFYPADPRSATLPRANAR